MVRSAIFIEPNQPLQIREYPTPSLESGAILAKVRLATICGSDLHTFLGRRGADAPSILGHEIVGEIVTNECQNSRGYKWRNTVYR